MRFYYYLTFHPRMVVKLMIHADILQSTNGVEQKKKEYFIIGMKLVPKSSNISLTEVHNFLIERRSSNRFRNIREKL